MDFEVNEEGYGQKKLLVSTLRPVMMLKIKALK